MSTSVKDYVDLKIRQLFRNFLIMVEDLADEHASNLDRLEEKLPEHASDIKQADFFTEEKMQQLRKRVLDEGNNCIRSIEPMLSTIDAEIIFKVNGNEKQTNILLPDSGRRER